MSDTARTMPGLGASMPRRRGVSLEHQEAVAVQESSGLEMPVIITPVLRDTDLRAWVAQNTDRVRDLLRTRGAILFRGFGIRDAVQLEALSHALSPAMLDYVYGSTPRRRESGQVYTSTEYPADQTIPLHNEMAYASRWPMKIWFMCSVAATSGGETPIADSRRVYDRIPAEIRERFMCYGISYIRNFGSGIDISWQDAFETSDRSAVERYCQVSGISYEWFGSDRLRTSQVCQAATRHPETGEFVWFNQAHLFHLSNHEPGVRAALASMRANELPRNALYGDGTKIEDGVIAQIRAAYEAETIMTPWRDGDVMLLDNMLMAHGRNSFNGPRKILVAMAEEHVFAADPGRED
jgi:hypothetical protein